jgi:hypothetical protein
MGSAWINRVTYFWESGKKSNNQDLFRVMDMKNWGSEEFYFMCCSPWQGGGGSKNLYPTFISLDFLAVPYAVAIF